MRAWARLIGARDGDRSIGLDQLLHGVGDGVTLAVGLFAWNKRRADGHLRANPACRGLDLLLHVAKRTRFLPPDMLERDFYVCVLRSMRRRPTD